jgi:hypothetical protein
MLAQAETIPLTISSCSEDRVCSMVNTDIPWHVVQLYAHTSRKPIIVVDGLAWQGVTASGTNDIDQEIVSTNGLHGWLTVHFGYSRVPVGNRWVTHWSVLDGGFTH